MACKNHINKIQTFCFIAILFVLFGFSEIALAASASVSLSGTQGLVTVTNFASFSTCTNCNDEDPPTCYDYDVGSLNGFYDGHLKCIITGAHGSATCSYEINTAKISNGTHTFMARANDCTHNMVTNTATLDVDNTPDTIVSSPDNGEEVAGEFEISGMAFFKPNPEGVDGEIHIYVDGVKRSSTSAEGSPAQFRYELDAGRMTNGQHTFFIRAVAANGFVAEGALFTFIVDNTPEIDLTAPYPNEEVEGEFDIAGNVNFKPNPTGAEGEIIIYLNGSSRFRRTYEGTTAKFSYNAANPDAKLNAANMANGLYSVTVRAIAANGTISNKSIDIIVDNTPEITISTPSPNEKISGKFDFSGNTTFKDNPAGTEGTIYYYLDGRNKFSKNINQTVYQFSYNNDKSDYLPELDPALYTNWNNGFHSLSLKAVSANGSTRVNSTWFIIGCEDPTYSLDNDGDGINDCKDACPRVRGNTENGCKYNPLDQGRDPKEATINCSKVAEKGDPVSIYTGNLVESEFDLDFTSPFVGGLTFKRFYNSQNEDVSPMGYGWTHNYNITLQSVAGVDSEYLLILDDTGFGRYFKEDPNAGIIIPLFEERTSLIVQDNTYVWERENGKTYTFDATTRQLLRIADRLGNRQTVGYSTTEPELIESVIDEASGRSLVFAYTDGFLSSVRLLSGVLDGGIQVTYGHDENGNLTTATFADGSGFVYTYDDTQNDPDTVPFINNLTQKTDTADHLLATWAYDDQDRCYHNDTTDDRGVTIDYDTTADAVIVTDAYGVSRTYLFTTIKGRKRIADVTGDSGCSSCVEEPIRWEYDEHLNVIEMEYANGRIDRFSDFDDRGNAETTVRAVGTAEEKETTSIWHPTLNEPLARSEKSVLGSGTKITIWDYDDDNNDTANEDPTTMVHRMVVSGFTQDSSEAVFPVESITTFAYDTQGQLTHVDGPLTGTGDTTTYTYDSITGDLLGVTRPVSGTTTFSEYDAAGRPGHITDPSLNIVDFAYDGRGRVTTITRQWDGAVTGFSYTPAGMPDTVTLPNGVTLTHDYDQATGRLTSITDTLGNRVNHGYDDQGNIVDTGYFLPSGTRTFWQRFDYQHPDRPGKLHKVINPDDTFFEYDYDIVGNVIQVMDPAGKITAYAYGLLNRMTTMVQPGSVVTGYDYDEQGNLVLVTDPDSVTTEYVVDDLGRTVKIVSPDAGTIAYVFDETGNPVSKTDANGVTTTYTYDNEYRLTTIHYPDPTGNVSFTYDQGTNGKGRITSMTDSSGFYAYAYDAAGNLIREDRTIEGRIYTTTYGYDDAGNVKRMTYPDGRTVEYELDAAGRVSRVTTSAGGTTSVVAQNIEYLPFGPISDYDSGDGVRVDRFFDQSYRTTGIIAGTLMNRKYTMDPKGNVTAITDDLEPVRSQKFNYDDVYRLTVAEGIYGTLTYGYDKVGNRLTVSEIGGNDEYLYESGTNRIQNIITDTSIAYTHDDAGNITSAGGVSYVYNQNNRLIRASKAGEILGDYVYSANGQRIKATTAKGTTIFHYDQTGNLIGESTADGDFLAGYIYLGSQRLAAVVPSVEEEVRVEVFSSTGRPISDIKVYAFRESGAYTGHMATTDDAGKAVFDSGNFPAGNYSFRADYMRDRFWSESIQLPDDTPTKIIISEEPVTIHVTMAGVSKPGVKVYLFDESGRYLGLFSTTDEAGNVSFLLPSNQEYQFRADLMGGRFMSSPFIVAPGEENMLTIDTGGGKLTVTLEKEDHAPIAGINVHLFSISGKYLGHSDTTDTEGRVAHTVPKGTYKVRADYLDHQFWSGEIMVQEDTTNTLVIWHETVTINVERDWKGNFYPLSDIPAYLFSAKDQYLGVKTETDEQGKVILELPTGDFKVRADWLKQQHWSETFNQTDETITIDEGMATVTVTGQGAPLSGVSVYVFTSSGTYLGIKGETDGQGQADFRLPEGDYNFRADYMGGRFFSGEAAIIAHIENPVGITTGGGNLHLAVEKEPGSPIAGLACYLFAADDTYLEQKQVTSGDGVADFILADGDYQIRVDYLGYRYWTEKFSSPSTNEVRLGIPHYDITIGLVGDNAGDVQTKAGMKLYLFTPDCKYLEVNAETDADGKAQFFLPDREYVVRADYLKQRYWSDAFSAADATIAIFEGIAWITVTQGQDPIENVNVHVFDDEDRYLGISAATDTNGRGVFRLPEGVYRFRADHLGNRFWASAEIEPGLINEIALTTGGGKFSLVVQKKIGEPLADIPVHLFSTTGKYLGMTANTNESGEVNFEMADGEYQFRMDYLGCQFWTRDYAIPENSADIFSIDHREVTITVNEKFGYDAIPIEAAVVYLFNTEERYLGRKGTTDAEGRTTFSLPPADYRVRVDYLRSQHWSADFNQTDTIVDIDHGHVSIHVTDGGYDLYDVSVHVFTNDGAYISRTERTDSSGMAPFLLPTGSYKFRVDHDGNQIWSETIHIIAHKEIIVQMDIELLLSDLTLHPHPKRFDGETPKYTSEKLMLAAFGPMTNLPANYVDSQNAVDKLYYFINDHLGAPIFITDESGYAVWKGDYRPFGQVDITADTFVNNFRFAGQYYDEETGLHYNYHRYYDTFSGRYLTPDPIGLEGGINVYAYVKNNPVNYVDPLGLFSDGVNAGGSVLGHSDFTGNNRFDFTKEDYGYSNPFNPLSTWRHFRNISDVEKDLTKAVINRDKSAFESFMHQGQDYFSHYSKGFRWYPQWDHGWGHADAGTIPDRDFKAWKKAEAWTKQWIQDWDSHCP